MVKKKVEKVKEKRVDKEKVKEDKKVEKEKVVKKVGKEKGVKKVENAYLCPKCKSLNVKRIIGLGTLFGLFSKWKCNKCGFEEKIFPLLEVKGSGGKKSSKKKK